MYLYITHIYVYVLCYIKSIMFDFKNCYQTDGSAVKDLLLFTENLGLVPSPQRVAYNCNFSSRD